MRQIRCVPHPRAKDHDLCTVVISLDSANAARAELDKFLSVILQFTPSGPASLSPRWDEVENSSAARTR